MPTTWNRTLGAAKHCPPENSPAFFSDMNQAIAFSVRVSSRAKWASLRISIEKGLEVVVPRDYDVNHVPAFVESHRRWIEKHRQRFEKLKAHFATAPNVLPDEITFA